MTRRRQSSPSTLPPRLPGRGLSPSSRKLEPLEERILLALVVVDTSTDFVDGTITSVEELLASPGDDGKISLREAIEATNNTPGADEIKFDDSLLGGVIVLAGEQLTIADDLKLSGPGADKLAIDGDERSRVVLIDDGFEGSLIEVEISGLALQKGRSVATSGASQNAEGGGLLNRERLVFERGVVASNFAERGGGGIDAAIGSQTAIVESRIFGNVGQHGGGVLNAGEMRVAASEISGNSSTAGGGGIANIDDLVIADSTISGNSGEYGGGIYNIFSDLVITNSTISGNSATIEGGGIYNFGTAKLTNATLSGNAAPLGGGFRNAYFFGFTGNAEFRNTIVANSTSGNDVSALSFTLATEGVNLISDGSYRAGPNVIHGEARLGPLADNGGPTRTHALLPGSPAIDAGDSALARDAEGVALVHDQRGAGYPRIIGGSVDLGAVEFWSSPTVRIEPVVPDPRDTGVSDVQIVFSEPVSGFDLGDLYLDRAFDGKGDLLRYAGFNSAPTLTTEDGRTYLLSGLERRTATAGDYVLGLEAENSGIEAAYGRPLVERATTSWRNDSAVDVDPPTVKVRPVEPNPSETNVDVVEIVFSEPVIGFELDDLNLDQNYDGLGNRLTGTESLTSSDGQTYILSGLAPLTKDAASYVLSFSAVASGVSDLAGNRLAANGHARWTRWATPLAADLVVASPDPRDDAPVDVMEIVFAKHVIGWELRDLSLERANDGRDDLVRLSEFLPAPTLATEDDKTFVHSNLASRTDAPRDFWLRITADGSGVQSLEGTPLSSDLVESWASLSASDGDSSSGE